MRDLSNWEKCYYSTRSRLSIPYLDLKEKWPVGFLDRLKMWKMGFLCDKFVAYDFKKYEPDKYLTDYQQVMARFINYPYSEILNNKLIFEKVFSRHVKVPKSYAVIDSGRISLLDPEAKDIVTDGENILRVIEELCCKFGRVVLKPVKGALGKGVMIIVHSGQGQLVVNNQQWSSEELAYFLGSLKLYLVSEYIEQAAYSKQIYPFAANAMRILTMFDPYDNQPFIAAAVKRFGTDASAPVDNNGAGGICASVNLETGELSSASQFTKTGIIWHDFHLNSGAQIKGIRIPNWTAVKEKVLEIAGRYPFIKYVGWDILDQDDGIVALEGNNHPQFRLLQIHKPILLDPRVVNFYRYHKIIG